MPSIRGPFAVALSGVYLFTNVVAAHAAETGFWQQRRAARRADAAAGLLDPSAAASPLSFDRFFGEGVSSSQPSPKILNTPLGPDLGEAVQPFGALGEVRLAEPSAPLVVLIQDVHTEDAAQINIGRLLGALAQKGVTTAALEGAWTPLETAVYRRHPSPSHLARAADYFRAAGYISGPEWAALAEPTPPRMAGVEDPALYYENVRAARRCVREGPRTRAAVDGLWRSIEPLKKNIYSPALAAFDHHRTAFHAGRGKVGDYARFLAPHGDGPELRGFVAALDLETRIDFAQAERERRRVLERLIAALSPNQAAALLKEAQRYRAGGLTAGEFNVRLRRACARAGVDLKATPAFAAYLDYIEKVESIQRRRLLEELTAAERSAGRALARTEPERRLLALSEDVDLLARLTASEMTPATWTAYRNRRAEIVAVPARLAAFTGESVPDLPDVGPFEQFCENALARNDALAANALRLARENNARSVALVAGGFHTDGLMARLSDAGASVVVVTPRFEKSSGKPLDAFARDPLPLEKIFAGARIKLPLARVLVPLEALDPTDRPRAEAVQNMLLPTADAFARGDGANAPAAPIDSPATVSIDAEGHPSFMERRKGISLSRAVSGFARRFGRTPADAAIPAEPTPPGKVDTYSISHEVLQERVQRYDRFVHTRVNPGNRSLTLLEGAGGNDLVRPFISINPRRVFVVTRDPRFWDLEHSRELLTRPLDQAETTLKHRYQKARGALGWFTAFDVETTPFGLALRAELESLSVDMSRVELSASDTLIGALTVRFPWRHPTEGEETMREVVYWRGDITDPSTYRRLLDAYDVSVDVYRHSAAMDVPAVDYPRGPDSFLNVLARREASRRTGALVFVTGDVSSLGNDYMDFSPRFPVIGARLLPHSEFESEVPIFYREKWTLGISYGTYQNIRTLDLAEVPLTDQTVAAVPAAFRARPLFVFDPLFARWKAQGGWRYAAYVLLAVLVAPVVEEYVFRHLVFGGALETLIRAVAGEIPLLRESVFALGVVLSVPLFAHLHEWVERWTRRDVVDFDFEERDIARTMRLAIRYIGGAFAAVFYLVGPGAMWVQGFSSLTPAAWGGVLSALGGFDVLPLVGLLGLNTLFHVGWNLAGVAWNDWLGLRVFRSATRVPLLSLLADGEAIRPEALVDPRPVAAGLLQPAMVAYRMAMRRQINPGHRPLRVLYGGAGADVAGALLDTNGSLFYFLDTYGPMTEADLRPLQKTAAEIPYPAGFEDGYLARKRKHGYAWGSQLSRVEERVAALRIELTAMGVDPATIGIETFGGRASILFPWAYAGQPPRLRRVVFVNANVTRPEAYADVLARGTDIYLQRAGLTIAKEYGHRPTFYKDIADSMPPGAVFATDDMWVDGLGMSDDNAARFPLALPVARFPGEAALFDGVKAAVSEGRAGIPETELKGYGNRLNVRFVPAGAVPVAGAEPARVFADRAEEPDALKNKLVSRPFLEHDLSVRSVVNPLNQGKTVLYGGAGADVSNVLLSWSPERVYMVAPYPGLTVDVLRAAFSMGVPSTETVYSREKYAKGYSRRTFLSSSPNMPLAIAIEVSALGVPPQAVEVLEIDGRPALGFPWEGRRRTIVFHDGRMENVAAYRDILDRGLDGFYLRAGMSLAAAYERPDSFLFDIAAAFRPGGLFVTDDYEWQDSLSAKDYGGRFPFPAEEIPVPNEAHWGPLFDRWLTEASGGELTRWQQYPYGWGVRVRRLTAPVARPVRRMPLPALKQYDEFEGLSFRDALGSDRRLKEIVLRGEPIGHFRLTPQGDGVSAVEGFQVQLRYRVSPDFTYAFFQILADMNPEQVLQFPAALWVAAMHRNPDLFEGASLRAMFQKDLNTGFSWDHAPAWNSAAFLNRLRSEGIPFVANEVLAGLVLRGRVAAARAPPTQPPVVPSAVAALVRLKPSDAPLRLVERSPRPGVHGPTHVVMALDGRVAASLRLTRAGSKAVLRDPRLDAAWGYPADLIRVFDLALAWARAQGAEEMEIVGCDSLPFYSVVEGQFGPGLLSVWSWTEGKWKKATDPSSKNQIEALPKTTSPVRSAPAVSLRAPTAGVLYRGTTVAQLRKNLLDEAGGVRLVGGRSAFNDTPFFAYNWGEAQGYALKRQTLEDPAVVIEVGHDALRAAGTTLPSLTRDPLGAQTLAGGAPLDAVRAVSVWDAAAGGWVRRVGLENIRSFVFAKASPLKEVVPTARFVSDPLEINPPHELDKAIDRLGVRSVWEELNGALSASQASRYFNTLFERLHPRLSDASPIIRRNARTVLAAMPNVGRRARPAQRREERRLWERVMRDPLSADGQAALEILRVWRGAGMTERAVLLRRPDLSVLEASLWRAADRASEVDNLGMPVRADIVGGSRYRFAEDRPDVDVLLSYRPDDSVVERWLQPRTVFNVYLRELMDALPPGSRVDPDPAGARVTMPSVAGGTARFLLNIHPIRGDPVEDVAKSLKALTRPIGRPAEAVTLERDYYLGVNWIQRAGVLGESAPAVTEDTRRLLRIASEIPDEPAALSRPVREQIEKRLHRPASVLLLTAKEAEPKPKTLMLLEPFLVPLKKWGRAGVVAYGTAVLVLSAAEEWVFRQFLLGDAVSAVAPRWLGFLGEGYVYVGLVLVLFTFLHPILRGVAGGIYNRSGRVIVPPEGLIDSGWRFFFGAVFTALYFASPEGVSNIVAHVLVNLWVLLQHREIVAGRIPSRPWPLMSILAGTPPAEKDAPIANMKQSRFDLARFIETARRVVPTILDADGRAVPAPLYVSGGDWDATQGPPADVRLVLDLGEKASGTDVDQRIMAFFTGWLAELKKTDVVESADTVIGPRAYSRLIFPSQGGKRVWSIPVHLRVVEGDPLAAIVADLEFQPRDLWDRIRRILRAEWLFGNPGTHARWLKTFHEQKKLKRAGEVFDTDPVFREAQERWRNPRAVTEALGGAAREAVERSRERALPGTALEAPARPEGPVLREDPEAVRGFLDLLMEGSRLDKNGTAAGLPVDFQDSIDRFNAEGFQANPSASGRWDLFYRGVRRYFRFVKLAGHPFWRLSLEWRPGWGLVLSMTRGGESRVFLVNNYREAMETKPTAVLSPQAVADLALVSEEQRRQNARVQALQLLERAVRASREGGAAALRPALEKDLAAFNASAPPFPVDTRRKGRRTSDRLLTLVRGDNRRLNFQNYFLTGDTVRFEILWPRGHLPVALITRADGRTLAFAVERFFESTEKNREIGAPPLWEFPSVEDARARIPRYLDLAETLVKIFNGAPAADQRALLDAAKATTLLSETTSFPLFRSDGSRLTTLVFRSPGEYALRFLRPKSGLELVATAGDQKVVFALGRFERAGMLQEVVGTPVGGTSRAQRSLLSESLAPLLAAHTDYRFLTYWDEPPKAAERREAFNREEWTVRTDGQGQVPLTLAKRVGVLEQIDVPAVLQPNALYTLKVEWVRAGGYVLALEGKDGVHAFALGRFRRAVSGSNQRRSVSAHLVGKYPSRKDMRAGLAAHPALLLRRAEMAGRQRAADPELMELLRGTEWVFTNTRSGKYLWEDPFDDQRWEFHGVGEHGRAHRVRLNVVDGVGVVVVFEYEGPDDVQSRFKIYSHLSAAVRRQWPKREIQLFPQRGVFSHPDDVAREIGGLRPIPLDAANVEGVPNSPEKMQRALERLIASYTPPAEFRGASAAVFPIEGPRALRARGRSSARFLVLLDRDMLGVFSRRLAYTLGEFGEVRTANEGRDLYIVYHGAKDRPPFVTHIRLSTGRLILALMEWAEELLQKNSDERLKLQSLFSANKDANGDSELRVLRMIERAWLVREYFNRLGPLSAQFERPEAGELNYRFRAWSYVNSDAFLSSERKLRAILARLRTVLTESDRAEYEKRLIAKMRSQKPLSSMGGKLVAAGTFLLMAGNAFGAEPLLGSAIGGWEVLFSLGAVALAAAVLSAWGRIKKALTGATAPSPAVGARAFPLGNEDVSRRLAELSPAPADTERLETQIDWRRVPSLALVEAVGSWPADAAALADLARGDDRGLRLLADPDIEDKLGGVARAALARRAEGSRFAAVAGAAWGARDGLDPSRAAVRARLAVAEWASALKDRSVVERTEALREFEAAYNAVRARVVRLRATGVALMGRDAVLDVTALFAQEEDDASRAALPAVWAALRHRLRASENTGLALTVRVPVDRATAERTLSAAFPGWADAPRVTLLLASEKEGASVLSGGRFSVAAYTERRGRPASLTLIGFTPDTLAEPVDVVEALGARLMPLVRPLGDELENALRTLRFLAINA